MLRGAIAHITHLESALAAEREKVAELRSQLAEVTLERDGLKIRNDNQARTIGGCHDTIKNAGVDPCIGVAKGVAAILAQRDALADRVRGLEEALVKLTLKYQEALRLLSKLYHDRKAERVTYGHGDFGDGFAYSESLEREVLAALTPPALNTKEQA